jgi:hypothetical protein
MNSYTHTNYTFNKVTKEVTLTGFTGVVQQIKYIKDLTADTVIFDPLQFASSGGTLAGAVLTLTFDTNTVAFNNSDTLEIIVEAGSVIGNNGTISAAAIATITTGGTAQTLFAANSGRMGWSIQNTSNDDLYVNDLGTATTASYRVAAGAEYNPNSVNSSAISILGATTGQSFVAREWNVPNITGSTLFVQGATPAGQQVAASSYPVVPATNYVESVQKEWKVKTAGTGTVVGDILIQAIKSNAGTINVTWFNLTQGTLLGTAPTISSLVENNQSGQVLPANQNGRQSFAWTSGGWAPSATGIQNLGSGNVSIDGGANVATNTTYTVPAGKRLRILSMDFTNTTNTTIAANARVWCGLGLKQDTVTPISTSPDIYKFRWMTSNNTTSAQMAPVLNQNMLIKFPDGAIDIAPGRLIAIWCHEAEATGFAPYMSINGYLYDAQ